MSTLKALDAVKGFLAEKVSPKIQLQKPNDNNVNSYELTNPAVFVGWLPPKEYLPDGMDTAIPCLIVGMDDGTDDSQDSVVNVRITAAVFSPGMHEPDPQNQGKINYTPDFKGYIDLVNLIDLTKAQLRKNTIIGNVVTVQGEIKYGIYQEQPYPYWYGWITFSARKAPYPVSEIARNILE